MGLHVARGGSPRGRGWTGAAAIIRSAPRLRAPSFPAPSTRHGKEETWRPLAPRRGDGAAPCMDRAMPAVSPPAVGLRGGTVARRPRSLAACTRRAEGRERDAAVVRRGVRSCLPPPTTPSRRWGRCYLARATDCDDVSLGLPHPKARELSHPYAEAAEPRRAGFRRLRKTRQYMSHGPSALFFLVSPVSVDRDLAQTMASVRWERVSQLRKWCNQRLLLSS
eukprot:scaffold479_cov376-Prasinococcus_capsulatus_cf.AAC.2